jgi:hypothetical protein
MRRRTFAAALLCAAAVVGPGGGAGPITIPSASAAAGFGASGEYTPVVPSRILTGARSFGDAKTTSFAVLGADAIGGKADIVPLANVSAVLVNVTVASATAPGYLTMWAGDQTRPPTANVNFSAGITTSNMAFVRPGANGAVKFALIGAGGATATVHVDVFGYFTTSAGAPGGRLVRTNPERILDTRPGTRNVGRTGALGPKQDFGLKIRGVVRKGTSTVIVPNDPNVTAVLLNLAAVSPTATTTVVAGPTVISAPRTANVSLQAGAIRSNLAVVPIGADGAIHLYNQAGSIHLVADVLGYFRKGVGTTTTAGRVIALSSPVRAIDTRTSKAGAAAGPLGPAQKETWLFSQFVNSVNIGGVPVGPQSALLANLTAVKPRLPYPTNRNSTFMKAFAAGAAVPATSNINLLVGEVVPNLTLAGLSATDQLAVYNDYAYVDYVLDVAAVVLE